MDSAARETEAKRISDNINELARKRSEAKPLYVASLRSHANLRKKRRRAEAAIRASELRRKTGNKQEDRVTDGRERDMEENESMQSQARGKEANDDEPEEACCRRRRRRCAPRRKRRRSSCRRRRRRVRSCGRRRRRSMSRRRRRRSCGRRRRRARRSRRGCGCS